MRDKVIAVVLGILILGLASNGYSTWAWWLVGGSILFLGATYQRR